MSDFAIQQQQQTRTIISSTDLLAGSAQNFIAWGTSPSANVWPVANRAIYIPILISQPFTATSMFTANGSSTAGNIDVGIYTENGIQLASFGSVVQAATSALQTFNITDTLLLPGVYYMACAKDDAVGTFLSSQAAAVTWRAAGVMSQSSAFPLPNPATFAVAQDAYCPVFGIVGKAVL